MVFTVAVGMLLATPGPLPWPPLLLVPLGIWLIISPWVVTVTHSARAGIIWNNVVLGLIVTAMGLAAMGLTVARRPRH